MLAYFLSVIVGTGSLALYLAAFLFPEIHRQKDIFWSGLGLFYALVLWINGQSLSGGLLLGQALSVVLLGWFTWETLSLRREIIPANQRTPLPSDLNLPIMSRLPKRSAQSEPASMDDIFAEPTITASTPQPEEQVPTNQNIEAQPWIEIRQEFPKNPPQPPNN
jgi:Ycf66 protein N-terminus